VLISISVAAQSIPRVIEVDNGSLRPVTRETYLPGNALPEHPFQIGRKSGASLGIGRVLLFGPIIMEPQGDPAELPEELGGGEGDGAVA